MSSLGYGLVSLADEQKLRREEKRNSPARIFKGARIRLFNAVREFKVARSNAVMAGVEILEEEFNPLDIASMKIDVDIVDGSVHLFPGGRNDPRHGHVVVNTTTRKVTYQRCYGEYKGWWNHLSDPI